ncbi:MAG: hypothetical protein IKX88_09400, partial [Thermoguttaceae bacterium]|nr:hypothetical protein [Thermoguttaceae bacterium]
MSSNVVKTYSLLFAFLACLCLFSGCSNKGKTKLEGEVTRGGEPVALGTITFTPKAEGFRAIQTITDGKFEIPEKFGVQPGEYNVAIEGYEEIPEDDPDQVAKKAFPDYYT